MQDVEVVVLRKGPDLRQERLQRARVLLLLGYRAVHCPQPEVSLSSCNDSREALTVVVLKLVPYAVVDVLYAVRYVSHPPARLRDTA